MHGTGIEIKKQFRSYFVIVATDSLVDYEHMYVTLSSLVDRYLYLYFQGRRGCVVFADINLCNRLILDVCYPSK
jgi:hypothetical protein